MNDLQSHMFDLDMVAMDLQQYNDSSLTPLLLRLDAA